MLGMVLGAVGVPVGLGIGLMAGIDRILDMGRTAINICDDVTSTVYVAHSEGERIKPEFYVK